MTDDAIKTLPWALFLVLAAIIVIIEVLRK
jgi:hypothetical protein